MSKGKELTRIPQSVTTDLRNLQGTYGLLAPVVRDLLIFLSNRQMESMFGDITFTLDEFCQSVGRPKKELQRKLKEEDRIRVVGDQDATYKNNTGKQLLENYFELALWVATQRNIMVVTKNSEGDAVVHGIQLINKFEIGADFSSEKKQKKSYLIVLGGSLKDLLLNNYHLIELKDYRNIPSVDGWRDFYLYLARIIVISKYKKKQNQETGFIMSIDELCDIFGVNYANNNDKKKYITKTLNKIKKSIEYAKFEYEYIKNGNRYKYHVQFSFEGDTLEYFDEKIKAQFFKALLNEFQTEFINSHFHTMPHAQRALEFRKMMDEYNNPHLSRKTFFNWLFAEGRRSERIERYKDVFFKIYKVPFDETKGFDIEN